LAKSHSHDAGKISPPNCVHVTATIPEVSKGQPCDDAFNSTAKKSKGGKFKRLAGFIK